MAGIRDRISANRYLEEVYRPRFNARFAVPAREEGSAFVPWIGGSLDDILCEPFERTVDHGYCVRFENLCLQIPADRHRCHYSSLPGREPGNIAWAVQVGELHAGRELEHRAATGRLSRLPGAPLVPGSGYGYALRRFPAPAKKRTIHMLQNRTNLWDQPATLRDHDATCHGSVAAQTNLIFKTASQDNFREIAEEFPAILSACPHPSHGARFIVAPRQIERFGSNDGSVISWIDAGAFRLVAFPTRGHSEHLL